MLSKKQGLTVAAFTDLICIVFSAWLYNFAIGAPILSFECILYTLVTSFIVAGVTFTLFLKKEGSKKLFIKLLLVVFVLQFVLYKPLFLLMYIVA